MPVEHWLALPWSNLQQKGNLAAKVHDADCISTEFSAERSSWFCSLPILRDGPINEILLWSADKGILELHNGKYSMNTAISLTPSPAYDCLESTFPKEFGCLCTAVL